jgi:hypothetical protein
MTDVSHVTAPDISELPSAQLVLSWSHDHSKMPLPHPLVLQPEDELEQPCDIPTEYSGFVHVNLQVCIHSSIRCSCL